MSEQPDTGSDQLIPPSAEALPQPCSESPAPIPGLDANPETQDGDRPSESSSQSQLPDHHAEPPGPDESAVPEEDEWVEEEVVEPVEGEVATAEGATRSLVRFRRRRRQVKADAEELRLQGRRAMCKSIVDIAPYMLKTVKLRVVDRYLEWTKGLSEDDLTNVLKKDAGKIAERSRILTALKTPDANFDRGTVKAIIFNILLQEETHSCPENQLNGKVMEFEKDLVKRAKTLDFFDPKKHDPERWHHYDTYRIVLEAAWADDNTISPDEARLLAVLRNHLNIALEEHWLIGALLKHFPKEKCALHTPDEINEARKELQRAGLLWSYRDEDNQNIDVIPAEVVTTIRGDFGLELQRTNYRRLVQHDSILLTELREILQKRSLDKHGNKAELIERVVASDIKPSEVLADLDKQKLSDICSSVSLRTSGTKSELIERLMDFYDDLTFEERVTRDQREDWYNNYELLASRAYAELRAKKLITKDLNIEHQFEEATEFLFETKLHVACDRSRKDNRADGRLPLDNNQSILWDCKSVEAAVNLQDHLDDQFDGYLRKENESGKQPLAFLVIGPSFTSQSLKLALQYKSRTNWDIALITAEGLKHLAERWAAMQPNKPFPVRLLNQTGVVDKDRAEYLLSLA